jgi:hypothetical protein
VQTEAAVCRDEKLDCSHKGRGVPWAGQPLPQYAARLVRFAVKRTGRGRASYHSSARVVHRSPRRPGEQWQSGTRSHALSAPAPLGRGDLAQPCGSFVSEMSLERAACWYRCWYRSPWMVSSSHSSLTHGARARRRVLGHAPDPALARIRLRPTRLPAHPARASPSSSRGGSTLLRTSSRAQRCTSGW